MNRRSNPTPPKAKKPAPASEIHFSRGARLGFLFLLLLTIVFAVGAMFVTYQLGNYKGEIARQLEKQLSANFTIGELSVQGFRGIQIDNVEILLPFQHGPEVRMEIPHAVVEVDPMRLLRGEIVLDHVQVDDAFVDVYRPPDSDWYVQGEPMLAGEGEFGDSLAGLPFRFEGTNARIRVRNVVNDTVVEMDSISFRLTRDERADMVRAELNGNLFGDTEKAVAIRANYHSMEEFQVRIEQELITHQDTEVFFPSDEPFVLSGEIRPTVQIYGGADNVIMINLTAKFENALVTEQPDFVKPATGRLNVFATYDTLAQELNVATAKIQSEQITGSIDGSVYFTEDFPLFDLQLICTQLPVQDMMDTLLKEQFQETGVLDITLGQQQQLAIRLQGTSDNPIVKTEARSNGGSLRFTPKDENLPPVELELGAITGTWDSLTEKTSAMIDIVDGDLRFEDANIEATGIRGTLTLAENIIVMSPINATVTNNSLVGSLIYDIDSADATIALEGTVRDLENTILYDAINNTFVGGAINLKCEARKRGEDYFLDAQVEASQAQLDYQWWFKKPPGIGAKGVVNAHFRPEKGYHFKFDSEVASSQLSLDLQTDYIPKEKGYRLMHAELSSSYIDITQVGACIDLPYRITGSTGGYGFLTFDRDPNQLDAREYRFGGFFENADVLPLDEKAGAPIHLENAMIELLMRNIETASENTRTGDIQLTAETLHVPPFTSTWFVPVTPPPEFEVEDRDWTYAVNAHNMTLPPWKGTDFSGAGSYNKESIKLDRFAANIDGGSMSGRYAAVRKENSYTTDIAWEKVPVRYVLEHLNYDDVMTGALDGYISYSVDRDDPSTLQGEGNFTVSDGHFSADFLYGVLGGNEGGGLSSLPPSLEFVSLRSDVKLKGDMVTTDEVLLDSEGIQMQGSGNYIHDGDMNYTIKVSLSPEMAQSIPDLRENLNLEGYKLSQRTIDLGFNITGPTFNPRGELAETPSASVTLVSGALEVTKDTISIIDMPRKILVDLLKIGGGIVGAGASK